MAHLWTLMQTKLTFLYHCLTLLSLIISSAPPISSLSGRKPLGFPPDSYDIYPLLNGLKGLSTHFCFPCTCAWKMAKQTQEYMYTHFHHTGENLFKVTERKNANTLISKQAYDSSLYFLVIVQKCQFGHIEICCMEWDACWKINCQPQSNAHILCQVQLTFGSSHFHINTFLPILILQSQPCLKAFHPMTAFRKVGCETPKPQRAPTVPRPYYCTGSQRALLLVTPSSWAEPCSLNAKRTSKETHEERECSRMLCLLFILPLLLAPFKPPCVLQMTWKRRMEWSSLNRRKVKKNFGKTFMKGNILSYLTMFCLVLFRVENKNERFAWGKSNWYF